MEQFSLSSTDSLRDGRPSRWEKLFAISVLLYSTGAFLPLLQGERTDPSQWTGTLITNMLWSVIYCICFFFLFRRRKKAFSEFRANYPLLFVVAIAPISLLWSRAPFITFLESGTLFGTTLIAVYLYRRFTVKQLLILCGWALGIAAALSTVFVIALPSFGVGSDEFQGDWLGIYGHKNSLGAAMTLGFLVFILLARFVQPFRWKYLFLAGSTLSIVYFSGSTSSLVVCLTLPMVLWTTQLFVVPARRIIWRRIGMLLLLAAVASSVVSNFESITTSIGRDETLTGRTTLWVLVFEAIQERPLLGYGYEAFWRANESDVSDIWEQIGRNMFYSHNGLLEVWLGLGILGVLVVIGVCVLAGIRALLLVRERFCLETVWPWLFLWYLLLSNLTEASLTKANTLPWILFLVVLQLVRPGHVHRRAECEMVLAPA